MAAKTVNSQNGELRLLETWMVEKHNFGSYFRRILRSEVAKLFKKKEWQTVSFQGASYNEDTDTYAGSRFFDSSVEAFASKTRVVIGCTVFTGPNVEILRKWALRRG